MIALYCSKTLQNFIKFDNTTITIKISKINSWNSHIFKFGGKNCLLFINNKSFYSFALYDFQKKDLINLDILFLNGLIEQLKKTNSVNDFQEKQIRERFTGINLHSKIDNKPIVSRLNNNIILAKGYHLFEFDGVSDIVKEFYNNINFLNDLPNPRSDFNNPVLEMEASIDLIFKNDL